MSAPQQNSEYDNVPVANVVYGIPIQNDATAKLTRRVLNVSIAMALIALATFIVDIATGRYTGIGFLIAVGIPACGYFGAKRKDRGLLSWFWACNLMCVVLFVISAIVLFGVTLPALDCLCSQECRQDNDIASDDPEDKEDIDDVCGRQDELRQLYLVGFGIGLVMAILQCAGVVYGRELAQHSYFVSNHAAAPGTAFVPTAQPVQVQAQRAQPAAQGGGGYNPQPAAQATSYGQHAPLYDAPGAGYPQHGGYNQSGGYPQQGGYPKTAS